MSILSASILFIFWSS